MYARILVPLDGSRVADQVLPYVRLLGKGLEARVDLLRIFEPVPASLADPAHGLDLDRIIASERSHVQDYLERVAESLRKDGLTVSSTVCEGHAAGYIVREAETVPPTLVAMCSHGRSGITRWVLGSTTDKVLHTTSQPVLIVRSRDRRVFGPEVRLSSILVPLDGSVLAEQALPHVVGLATALGLKVILIRATPSAHDYTLHFSGSASYSFAHVQDLSKRADAEARKYLDTVSAKLRQQGVSSVEMRILHGHPATSLVDMAWEVRDSMVVMTTHGDSGIDRWIRGSVADRVVRYSGEPVLVIRAVKDPSMEV
jgi:nucleotide-binding universal stress UspA family protein